MLLAKGDLHSAEGQVSSAWYFLICESLVFQPYHCPKGGVLRWYVFPFVVQNLFSSKGKKALNQYSLVFPEKNKGKVWMLLPIFACNSAWSWDILWPLPFTTFSWRRKEDGSERKTLSSCGCRPKCWEMFSLLHSQPLECVLSFYSSSSTKSCLGNLDQRLSWQPQTGVMHYQGAQIFFLQATWAFKMLSISCKNSLDCHHLS